MRAAPAERTVLVGLDGATFSVLDPLMADGSMPVLARLASQGVRGVLRSTPHPLTPPAWTTVMTGRMPGNHGVFDFIRVDQRGPHPTYTLATSAEIGCETIWSIASRHGCRVTALNFPCTFPAPPVDGFVVPGYVPGSYLARAVHPRELYARLKMLPAFDPRELGVDWSLERKAVQGLPEEELEAWVEFHTSRERQWFEILTHLMRDEPCELTAVCFDGVDRVQHLCYHLLDRRLASHGDDRATRRLRSLCLDYFRQLDAMLGDIVSLAGPDARLFVVSDHGFEAAGSQIFYANVWLEQQGYLKWADGVPLDRDARLALDDHTESTSLLDWSRTTAFALTSSSNAIFIRRADSAGEPGVPPHEYEAFRERLRASLLAFEDPVRGGRVVESVLTREDAFPGPYSDRAPDLTLVLREPGFLSVLRADAPLKARSAPYATHHPDGVFLAHGAGIRVGATTDPLSIATVAPTLLYSLGLPIPPDMADRPAVESFEPSFVASHPARVGAPLAAGPDAEEAGPEHELDAEAEARIFERLRTLGYVE